MDAHMTSAHDGELFRFRVKVNREPIFTAEPIDEEEKPMALIKLKDLEFEIGPHSLARDPETGSFSLTRPGGEDPYGVPYHVPVEPVAVPQKDLLRALGSVASELETTTNEAEARRKQLEADLAIEKQRVSSAAGVRSGT